MQIARHITKTAAHGCRGDKHVPFLLVHRQNVLELEPGKAQMRIDLCNHVDERGEPKPHFTMPSAAAMLQPLL